MKKFIALILVLLMVATGSFVANAETEQFPVIFRFVLNTKPNIIKNKTIDEMYIPVYPPILKTK